MRGLMKPASPLAGLTRYRTLVDRELKRILPKPTTKPARLHAAMHYSLFGPGKRLRPILTLLAAEGFRMRAERAAPVAAAFELVHSYSLVHDDLPCMDDDDFRRGRPTTHIKFDEATAVLTGDALLTLAFEALADATGKGKVPAARTVQLVKELARASGSTGLIGGQVDDLAAEGRAVSLHELRSIHRRKTGELFTASLRAGAILAGARTKELAVITRFGHLFGQVFQITDDILDEVGDFATLGKPTGSDRRNEKATYVRLLSLERSRSLARRLAGRAAGELARLPGLSFDRLVELTRYLPQRADA
jgi:geranylgeranyl pyrophosphate synthase